MSWSTTFPEPLARLQGIDVDMDVMDYEPYDAFWPPAENASWFSAWTGNDRVDGAEFRVFGVDGSGGQVAFWLTDEGADLLDQPVVFLGSEGDVGVLARNFWDYVWLLAAGIGPMEAVEYGADEVNPQESFEAFAKEVAPGAQKGAAEVLERAQEAYPGFEEWVQSLCE